MKLKEYLEYLSGLKGVKPQELESNIEKRAIAERYLQLSIEVCVDVAEMIISDQRLPVPQTSVETIEILGKQGIINKEFAFDFAKSVSFRNILVHDYVEIDYGEVAQKINDRLGDFDRYAKEIASFIS